MLPFLLLVACASEPKSQAAEAVTFGDSTVGVALERLDARVDTLEAVPEATAGRFVSLEERMTRLEILLAQSQIAGDDRPTMGAVKPGLDSPTTLATIDERLSKLEDKVFAGAMGDPGSALFDLPKDPAKPVGGKGGPPAGGPPPGQPPGGKAGPPGGGPPPGQPPGGPR